MIRMLAGAAIAIVALSGSALADPMADRYENTTTATNAKGEVIKLYYNADKSVSATMADGSTVTGVWDIVDSQVCLTQLEPAPAEGQGPLCFPLSEHTVGDKWEVGEGETAMTVEIVAGR